jgi:hypothetical protein
MLDQFENISSMENVNLTIKDLTVKHISAIMRSEYKFDEEIIRAFEGNLPLF